MDLIPFSSVGLYAQCLLNNINDKALPLDDWSAAGEEEIYIHRRRCRKHRICCSYVKFYLPTLKGWWSLCRVHFFRRYRALAVTFTCLNDMCIARFCSRHFTLRRTWTEASVTCERQKHGLRRLKRSVQGVVSSRTVYSRELGHYPPCAACMPNNEAPMQIAPSRIFIAARSKTWGVICTACAYDFFNCNVYCQGNHQGHGDVEASADAWRDALWSCELSVSPVHSLGDGLRRFPNGEHWNLSNTAARTGPENNL